jgi:hypothetical protein
MGRVAVTSIEDAISVDGRKAGGGKDTGNSLVMGLHG